MLLKETLCYNGGGKTIRWPFTGIGISSYPGATHITDDSYQLFGKCNVDNFNLGIYLLAYYRYSFILKQRGLPVHMAAADPNRRQ